MNAKQQINTADFLRSFLEGFPAMSWLADLSSARVYFSRAWLNFTGRSPREESGFGWRDGVHPDDANSCMAAYVAAFHSRAPFFCAYRLKNSGGEYIAVNDAGWPFNDENGNFAGYLGFCTAARPAQNAPEFARTLHDGSGAKAPPSPVAERPSKSYDILVAEDNRINYMLVEELLKKLGHRPQKAENGRQAVEMAGRGGFDIIFMDIQMPVLDGYEATREIRRRDPSVPIVAITASAMKGDYEKCLEAGMNDYVSKPIDIEKFSQVIERNVSRRRAAPPTDPVPQRPSPAAAAGDFAAAPAFDREKFVRNTFGNESLARNILRILFEDLDKYMAAAREAITAGDAETVFKSAHRLKGSAGNVCADRLRAAFLSLETAGRESRLEDAARIARNIEIEIAALKSELQKYGY